MKKKIIDRTAGAMLFAGVLVAFSSPSAMAQFIPVETGVDRGIAYDDLINKKSAPQEDLFETDTNAGLADGGGGGGGGAGEGGAGGGEGGGGGGGGGGGSGW